MLRATKTIAGCETKMPFFVEMLATQQKLALQFMAGYIGKEPDDIFRMLAYPQSAVPTAHATTTMTTRSTSRSKRRWPADLVRRWGMLARRGGASSWQSTGVWIPYCDALESVTAVVQSPTTPEWRTIGGGVRRQASGGCDAPAA